MSAVSVPLGSTLLFFSVFVVVSAVQINIIAVSGQDVTLPCRVTNNITAVEWSRAGLEPKNVFLYQDGRFVPNNQHPSYKNRVALRGMKDGDASLIVKKVTTADSGTYKCRVKIAETGSWKYVTINLNVSPDQMNITAESGQDVTLTCQITNKISAVLWSRAGLEPKNVFLYQDGRFVPNNQHPSYKNRVALRDRQMKGGDVSLILKNVTTADSGTYKCRVFLRETGSWKFTIINLRVDPPVQINIIAVSGQDVTLPCRVTNNITAVEWSRAGLEPKNVFLYQDGRFVPNNQHPSYKNRVALRGMKDGDASLIVKKVTTADSGTYKCRVKIAETGSWKYVTINLNVSPDQMNITAESGQDVTLTCQITNKISAVLWSRAGLEPKNVFLYQDGRFVPNNQHPSYKNRVALRDRQMKGGDASLIVKKVTTADSGTYKCLFEIAETRSWKNITITLSVPLEHKILPAESGQKVTLTCRAPNNSKRVKWSRADLRDKYVLLYQDGHLNPDNQHPSFKSRLTLQDRQMKNGDVSLILKDANMADSGTYMCRVFMEETRSWKLLINNYLIVVPPGQKMNIKAESGQNVTLPCQSSNNNNSITGVKWMESRLEGEHVLSYQNGNFEQDNQDRSFQNRVDLLDIQMTDGNMSMIVNDLTPADSGTYMCGVFMEETRSWKYISYVRLRVTDRSGPTGGSVALIIGVSAVVLVVGFLIYKRKRRHSNTHNHPEDEQPLSPQELVCD
ncbi:obscurin-like isoform X3 [Simochromis diagramma]|uniref:obscurin-like isoform X3 n=1 Tax=Simochromis diagramma TaxID=43689 RepID=UPI001A7E756A|nr:obscurin-like isoform X3 [Simochromis diagramma]